MVKITIFASCSRNSSYGKSNLYWVKSLNESLEGPWWGPMAWDGRRLGRNVQILCKRRKQTWGLGDHWGT